MSHKEPPFGFWIPVTDKSSAEYAAKMSGLPVFLMGLGFLASGLPLIFSVKTIPIWIGLFTSIVGGLFLVFSGLRIRKLRFGTLPLSVTLWLILNSVAVVVSGIGADTILIGLVGIMALCGLRGWVWLKKNEPPKPV